MRDWKGLEIEAEGTGISEPLSRHVNLLGELLGDAIRKQKGQELFDLVEGLRRRCKQAASDGDEAIAREVRDTIGELDLTEIDGLLQSYASFFHLVNKAEQLEITRVNRERERVASPDEPRDESVAQGIRRLKEAGYSLDQVKTLLGRLDIQPTLTAHPTEARRRTVLEKQERISALLMELRRTEPTPPERDAILDEIYRQITLLLLTDEIRPERRTVEDEVRFGMYFCRTSIWKTVPRIHLDAARAVETYYGERVEVPVFLKYRTWIGGDRDGNPNVTPEVTRWTARLHRETALRLHLEELEHLLRDLSVAGEHIDVPEELRESIERDREDDLLDPSVRRFLSDEPFRLKVSQMIARLERELAQVEPGRAADAGDAGSARYTSETYLADLLVLRDALLESGVDPDVDRGRVGELVIRARAFGFHLATIDIRQHSAVHERTVAALLKAAGVVEDYDSLGEEERLRLLEDELRNPRPLRPRGASFPDEVEEMLETFAVVRDIIEENPEAIRSYVVSMTHDVSDLLEVLLLAKEEGLWRFRDGKAQSKLDVVPLFETIADLASCGEFMERAFGASAYRAQVAARGGFQEMMLGYSDGTKDGGYLMANWALYRAQQRLSAACRAHDVDFSIFHGRGGTVGRGGGRANQAILALPPESHTGHIRFTEQGEIISFRYALEEIAHRHLEQIVDAMIEADLLERGRAIGDRSELLDTLGRESMKSYRALIDDDGFFAWYSAVTPIQHISRLPIASRPASRGTGELRFDDLRAIPWVFAWTQTRYNVPGWYGVGTALEATVERHGDILREMYRSWDFFRAIIDSAQREMARARLPISRRYSGLSGDSFHQRIAEEYERTRRRILDITGGDELLSNSPVIRRSIELRNPYTDVLNLLQIELIHRWRDASDEEREPLGKRLLLSLNGIAAAMQSTG